MHSRSPDRIVAQIARRQHGVVTVAQLSEAGLGRGAIAHRVSQARLHRLYRGVYAVGAGTLPPLGAEMAAVLAFGGRAVVSHISAAAMWQLLPARPAHLHLTVVGATAHARRGLRLHRVSEIHPDDVRRM